MKRLVWGINPFDFNDDFVCNTAQSLQNFWPQADIQVCFIGSRLDLEIALAFDIPQERRKIEYPLEKLKENLTRIGFSQLAKNVRVTFEETISNRLLAKKMSDYAKSVEADAIVVTTHARKGVERLALGSFTETLTHTSPISVLTINPNFKPRQKLNTIFYASDMSHRAVIGYDKLLNLMDLNHGEIVYFHIQYPFILPAMANSNENFVTPTEEIGRAQMLAEERGLAFKSLLRENVRSVSGQLLEDAKTSDADIIVLQANANPIEAMLIGSVSRSVLRSTSLPVLLIK